MTQHTTSALGDRGFKSGGGNTIGTHKLGEFIRAERRARGFKQSELAELACVSERFVRDVEKGKATAEIGKVMALLSALGYDLVPTLRRSHRQQLAGA